VASLRLLRDVTEGVARERLRIAKRGIVVEAIRIARLLCNIDERQGD